MLDVGGQRNLPILGVHQARPQLGVRLELVRRVAEDRSELRAHVVEPAAVGHVRVLDVDVDAGGHVLDQDAVARVGDLLAQDRELELGARVACDVEQAAALVDEDGLADAGEHDHGQRPSRRRG